MTLPLETGILIELGKLVYAVVLDQKKASEAKNSIRALVESHFGPHSKLVLNEVLEQSSVVRELLDISPANIGTIIVHFKDAFEAAEGHTWDEGVRQRTLDFLCSFLRVLVDIGYHTDQAATTLLETAIDGVRQQVAEADARRTLWEGQQSELLSKFADKQVLSFVRNDFEEYLERAISASGDRYQPGQNVAIDDLKVDFAALVRDARHLERLAVTREHVARLQSDVHQALSQTVDSSLGALKALSNALASIVKFLNPIDQQPVRVEDVRQHVTTATDALRNLHATGWVLYKHAPHRPDTVLRRLARPLELESIANEPLIGLVGEAGIGKTHFLLQWARETLDSGGFAIVVPASSMKLEPTLGKSLIAYLGLGHHWSERDILQALSNAAAKTGRRFLIAVDAINEAIDDQRWRAALPVFNSTLKGYPWLRMVVSYRPTNKPDLFRNAVTIPEVVHPGFRDNEQAALEILCRHYGIEYASLPPFAPEFSNPLFVTLALRSLRYLGAIRWDRGLRGFTRVYDTFLEAANYRISHDADLDKDAAPVRKAVRALAQHMAEALHSDKPWLYYLPESEAKAIVDEAWPSRSTDRYSESLYRALLDEHVIERFRAYDYGDDSNKDVVRFAFQRFADHEVAAQLLNAYFAKSATAADLNDAFGPNGLLPLSEAPEGILTALAIQLSERFRAEMTSIDQPTDQWGQERIRRAAIESYKWRDIAAFPEPATLRRIINEKLGGVTDELIDVFLEVSVVPDHPLNANSTSRWLMPLPMAKRDLVWTLRINQIEGPVGRIITWARHGSTSGLSSQDATLAGIILTWFHTASNREVRDRATKALVHVLEAHPSLAVVLLEHFRSCNDPYVCERLYAAVYGAFLRAPRPELKSAADWFLEHVFGERKPYPNIRLRHYAQSLIDLAIHWKMVDGSSVSIHRPPYDLQLDPSAEGGSEETLEGILGPGDGSRLIASSMHCPMGDFGRYVVGSTINRTWGGSFNDCDGIVKSALTWMAHRIREYGYEDEWFAEYDRSYGRFSRSGGPLERIGKKYQWLAYLEYLAYKTDSYPEIVFDYDSKTLYQGPWQLWERDIDPSALLPASPSSRPISFPALTLTAFAPRDTAWTWLERAVDTPDFPRYLVTLGDDGTPWYTIFANLRWRDDPREVWLQARAYLVEDGQQAAHWMKERDLTGSWLPNWFGPEIRQGFVAEYPWHPSFSEADVLTSDLQSPEIGGYDEPNPPDTPRLLSLWADLAWESANSDEYSGELITPIVPSPWLVREGGLTLNPLTWEWQDSEGKVVAVGSSPIGQEPDSRPTDALLIRADWFDEFVMSRGLEAIWLVAGEKMVLSQDHSVAPPLRPYRPFGAAYVKQGSQPLSGSHWIQDPQTYN